MPLANTRRTKPVGKTPIGSMRVRTHEHRKRTASSERASARSYGLLQLYTDGDFNDEGRLNALSRSSGIPETTKLSNSWQSR
ncbi:hypothetical protein NDU88_004111 [Pleurodeles waltl]|uniref:Uncharacterized protein n=1 Tax=Pleurodeles waltl TaxID=8319 RepID=A0AAV7V208_PLEWA|nr:hypothetical protein NDU88_004111 [Pleurodeles waltl]